MTASVGPVPVPAPVRPQLGFIGVGWIVFTYGDAAPVTRAPPIFAEPSTSAHATARPWDQTRPQRRLGL